MYSTSATCIDLHGPASSGIPVPLNAVASGLAGEFGARPASCEISIIHTLIIDIVLWEGYVGAHPKFHKGNHERDRAGEARPLGLTRDSGGDRVASKSGAVRSRVGILAASAGL
jgi:hypothetical protein